MKKTLDLAQQFTCAKMIWKNIFECIHLEFINKPCSVLCMVLLRVEIHVINSNLPPSLSWRVKGIDQYGDAKNEQ